ncbi:hypothetical protein ENBRE01_0364 [Enteropsectra breve]|nr:hypothetical protein ENBRE01_0364 [Enteropsectra breve]
MGKGEPVLELTHSFTYKDVLGAYRVAFHSRYLTITSIKKHAEEETVKYEDIYKIKTRGSNLKIQFKAGGVIDIPCTIKEAKKIKTLFTNSSSFTHVDIAAVVFVELGETSFYVKVKSTNFTKFKEAILRKIAQVLYPSLCHDNIDLKNDFDQFTFKIRHKECLAVLETSDDLEAALNYNDYKLDIVIVKRK